MNDLQGNQREIYKDLNNQNIKNGEGAKIMHDAKVSGLDKNYWDRYYEKKIVPVEPSAFAQFVEQYIQKNLRLVDLGCGNGRDSMYFCSLGMNVTAIDSSQAAIKYIDEKAMPISTIEGDFVTALTSSINDYDYCYARWSIHAINEDQQNVLLPNIFNALKSGGYFFMEARTINDSKFGMGKQLGINEFFFDNHYRRFLEPESLKKQLEELEFDIVYFMESDTFSIVEGDSPTLIRVVAKKH
jgi:2-polyprenyl-3-methyl-5-hydroxy-6-metoxy-1,4-benzoquinol methylase